MQKKLLILSILISGMILTGCSPTQIIQTKPGQQPQYFTKEYRKTVTTGYLLYLPEDYGKEKTKYPLVLFLHGSGERGTDINLVKKHGPPMLVDQGKNFPFIIVSPQCPDDERWSTDVLDALLNNIEANYEVDLSRVYVTGLSMGGYGTWDLAITYPDRFAAIIPICGGGNADAVCKLKNIPAWVFHGQKDNVVPVKEAETMVNALKACGGNVKFTVYPEAGHNSWTETYNNPELYEWMQQQSLGSK
ncbi:MAG: prolyl oligopeptidase family serine peptidase [Ignavibacteriales bacterium]|nr:prolyl oligopeptidase family serine peptidase [Ignavibacteriales bacterium]